MQRGWAPLNSPHLSGNPEQQSNHLQQQIQQQEQQQHMLQMLQQNSYGNLHIDPSRQMHFYNARYSDVSAPSPTSPVIMDNKFQMFPTSEQYITTPPAHNSSQLTTPPNSFQMLNRPFLQTEQFPDNMISPIDNMIYQNNQFVQSPISPSPPQQQQLQSYFQFKPFNGSSVSYLPSSQMSNPQNFINNPSARNSNYQENFFTSPKAHKPDSFNIEREQMNFKRTRQSPKRRSSNETKYLNRSNSNISPRTSKNFQFQSNQVNFSSNKSPTNPSNFHHSTKTSTQVSKKMTSSVSKVIPKETADFVDFLQQSSPNVMTASTSNTACTVDLSSLQDKRNCNNNNKVTSTTKSQEQKSIDPQTSKRYNNTIQALEKAGLLDITLQTAELINKNAILQKDIDMLEEIVKVTKHLMGDI